MSEIVIASDADFRATVQAREMAAQVGAVLARTYPGYRWRIEPHPHPVKPFVDFEPETGLMGTRLGHIGGTVVLSDFATVSALDAKIKSLGGQMLELSGCNRRAFNETEFLGRTKNAFGMFDPLGSVA